MSSSWDIGVKGQDNHLALVVEVKNILNTTPEWASQFRRNILAHGEFPIAPFFLLALPDKFYLWAHSDVSSEKNPDYIIDARPILQPYFQELGLSGESLSGQSLELIVSSWLGKIVNSEGTDRPQEVPQWIIDSGLFKSLSHGSLNEVMM